MAWLLREGEVLATLEVAGSLRDRVKGLMGRDHYEGALLLRPAHSVHTVGMRFPIDVAFVDGEGRVVATVTMARHRPGRPRFAARLVVEAEAGAFERWGLRVGDVIEVKR